MSLHNISITLTNLLPPTLSTLEKLYRKAYNYKKGFLQNNFCTNAHTKRTLAESALILRSERISNHTLKITRCYVIECSLEMFPRIVQGSSRLVALKIRVDEFDKTIEVFCCDLQIVSTMIHSPEWMQTTYSIILLLKVINISVQDLYKEFNRHSRVHAGIGNSQSALQTLKNAFSISIKLLSLVNNHANSRK